MEFEREYHLQVNGKGEHNSFPFKTMNKAGEGFKFLSEKFSENRITDKNSVTSADGIVQLSICEVYIGNVPSGAMASFVPEDWFTDVYEEMLTAAREFYENNK